MKNTRILILLCLEIIFLSQACFCQDVTDSLSIRRIGGKEANKMFKENQVTKIERHDLMRHQFAISSHDTILTVSEASTKMSVNPEAQALLMDAHSKKYTADILVASYSFYALILGIVINETDMGFIPAILLVSVPLVPVLAISLPMYSKYYKLAEESVHLYNSGVRSAWNLPQPEIKLGFIGYGIGIRINF
ncbi:MAG: hypothetical protein MUO72_11910 [Bacteroidales bacterium]|nr:hypothetical protein [Bacteroidales bacterium]